MVAPHLGIQAMTKALRVVTTLPADSASPAEGSAYAALGERVRRLQAEAEQLAREHIGVFAASLAHTQRLSQEIALGGEAYPPGVREIARRLAEESQANVQALEAIVARRGAPSAHARFVRS
jgi:capsid protein